MNQKLFLVRMLVGAVIAFNVASISLAAPDAPEPRPSTLGASDPLKLPTIIYLMRHAEKPAAGNPHLSAAGVARADKLPAYLPSLLKSGQKIDYIFATKASADSNRPVETITPLAGALGLTINDSYDAKSYRALAKTILSDETYAQKVIVISWHHSTLPKLARALGARHVPKKWPGDAFNLIWQLTYAERGSATLQVTKEPF